MMRYNTVWYGYIYFQSGTGMAYSSCYGDQIQKWIPDSDSTENYASGDIGYFIFQAKKYFQTSPM